MNSRIDKGYLLFKLGDVHLIFEDETMLQYEVISGENSYIVTILNGIFRCNCDDFDYRFLKSNNSGNGSFLCKHCFGAMYEDAELFKEKQLESSIDLSVAGKSDKIRTQI